MSVGGQVLVLTVQNQRQQGAGNTRDDANRNSLRAHEQAQGVRVATVQGPQRMLLIVAHQVCGGDVRNHPADHHQGETGRAPKLAEQPRTPGFREQIPADCRQQGVTHERLRFYREGACEHAAQLSAYTRAVRILRLDEGATFHPLTAQVPAECPENRYGMRQRRKAGRNIPHDAHQPIVKVAGHGSGTADMTACGNTAAQKVSQ